MLGSIFYCITFCLAMGTFWFIKKSKQKLNGMAWTGVSFMLVLCYQVLIAGIYSLIHIRVNLLSIGLSNLLVCVVWTYALKKKKASMQQYYFEKWDLLPVLVIGFISVTKYIEQFGMKADIRYITSDPSVHLKGAMDVINTGKVSGMYFSNLTNAMFIQAVEPFVESFSRYKGMILGEGLLYFISGMVFWAALRKDREVKNKTLFLEVFCIVFYMLAYPLNNMIFGFSYLGMTISIIATIFVITNLYSKEKNNVCIVFLMLLCAGVGVGYCLFAPITYVAVCACITWSAYKNKDKISTWIFDNLKVFLLPSILTIIFIYLSMFSGSKDMMSMGIATEGYIYKDIFGNLWIILIPMLIGLCQYVKEKKICTESVFFILMLMFMGALYFMSTKGKVSAYYYYKLNYIMSLVAYLVAYDGLRVIFEESKKTAYAYVTSIALAFVTFLMSIEGLIASVTPQFIPYEKMTYYFDIYHFNNTQLKTQAFYDEYKLQLYREVFEKYHDEQVVCVSYFLDEYWYEALTDQRMDTDKYYYWKLATTNELFANIAEGEDVQHLVIIRDSEIYQENAEILDKLNIIAENPAGYIVELNESSREVLRGIQ